MSIYKIAITVNGKYTGIENRIVEMLKEKLNIEAVMEEVNIEYLNEKKNTIFIKNLKKKDTDLREIFEKVVTEVEKVILPETFIHVALVREDIPYGQPLYLSFITFDSPTRILKPITIFSEYPERFKDLINNGEMISFPFDPENPEDFDYDLD